MSATASQNEKAQQMVNAFAPLSEMGELTNARTASRRKFVRALEDEVVKAINDEISLDIEEDYDGEPDFKCIPDQTIEIELGDDASRGFMISRESFFSGEFQDDDCRSYDWSASVKKATRKGDYIALKLNVTAG